MDSDRMHADAKTATDEIDQSLQECTAAIAHLLPVVRRVALADPTDVEAVDALRVGDRAVSRLMMARALGQTFIAQYRSET